MSSSDTTIYQARADSGDYDRMLKNVKSLNTRALVGVEYEKHFKRNGKRGFKVKSAEEKTTVFSTWIFGEIASRSVGTLHQASGNHYIGRPPNYTLIEDSTRVKDVFMLRCPTDATRALEHLFNYQLTILNNIRLSDEDIEMDNNQANIDVLEWLRRSNPDQPPNLICVYFGPKYEVPESSSGSSAPRKRPRSKATSRIMVSPPMTSMQAKEESTPAPTKPNPTDIKLGAFYDPRLLPDYGGPLFKLKQAKLKQRHIIDMKNELVTPWNEYDKLRTGTVVLMRVTLHTYTIPNGNKEKKIYQIYADRAKILAISEDPIDNRSIRFVLSDDDQKVEGKDTDDDDEQLKCFDNDANTADDNTASGSSTTSRVPSLGPKPAKKANLAGVTTRTGSGKSKQREIEKLSDSAKLPSEMNVD